MLPVIYMVIPCYFEEEVLPETSKRLKEKYTYLIETKQISPDSKVLFVNDGSTDKTWEIIADLHERDKMFTGLCLSRNFGHQNAVLAGLMTAKNYCDAAISMDADLQDDINTIDKMVEEFKKGNDIVYGVRDSRETDTWFKRNTAQFFYKFMKFLGVEVVYNHADFRLMSKRVLDNLENFDEYNLFLRGIMPLIGFQSSNVYYARTERFAGESKYPLKKMLTFALNAITSFSIKPLRIITTLGVTISIISFLVLLEIVVSKLLGLGNYDWGWPSLICTVLLTSGIQIFCLGIIGEYIGKIYSEVKHRPKYVVKQFLDEEEKLREKK